MKWVEVLSEYLESPQYAELKRKVKEEYNQHTVYPPQELIFNATTLTPYEKVKCVILGQDPYHEPGQAMGLSFSVNDGVRIPPSLVNIYKEIADEYGYDIPTTGNLTPWARQGVLLLNSVLTVRAHQAASHKNIGWEECTDEILKALNKKDTPVVYMLWGNFAKKKAELITNPNHLVLTAAHPSPLTRGAFFGNNHFKKCNAFLNKHGIKEIDWRIVSST